MATTTGRVARSGARRELTLSIGFAVAVLLLIALGGGVATRVVAQREALRDAERSTQRLADVVVAPLVPDLLDGGDAVPEDLDAALASRLAEGSLTAVTVWRGDGRVIYSSGPGGTGTTLTPPPEVALALQGVTTSAFQRGVPEAAGRDAGAGSEEERYVEVYIPFGLGGPTPLAFEAYYDYERVDSLARQLLQQILPLVVLPLLVLELIQIPAAVSLARRLRRHEQDRARLLERALAVSEQERATFAADLHDGPIQDIAGISYALGAIAPQVPPQQAPLMTRVQEALSRVGESLRGLMVDLYPPDLDPATLTPILAGLAEPLRADGLDVRVELEPVPALSAESLAVTYRVAREALVNVRKHAQASRVTLRLEPVAGAAGSEASRVRLTVQDDGVGLGPGGGRPVEDGHLGLRLLSDRVETLGGSFSLTARPTGGTEVAVELPVAPGPLG